MDDSKSKKFGDPLEPRNGQATSDQNKLAFKHNQPYCTCLGVLNDLPMSSLPRFALSLSGCGFLGVYHFGSISCLQKHGKQFLLRCDRFAGASAGALVAAVLVTCPEKLKDCMFAWYRLADEVIQKPFGAFTSDYSLIDRVEQYVNGILPSDAHQRAHANLHISVTCTRTKTNCVVSNFESRENLVKYLVASCHIPFYAGTKRPVIDGEEYMDGGLSSNLPKFEDCRTITISPFSGEADISPEDGWAMFDWKVTLAKQTVKLNMGNMKRGMQALFPPSLQVLEDYYSLGYIDTMKFLIQHGFFEREEEMPALSFIAKRLLWVIQCVLAPFKRVLCIFGRRPMGDDDTLPFTVQQAGQAAVHNSSEFEGWDEWGTSGGRKRQKTESEQRIEAYRQRLSAAREEMEKANANQDETEEAANYFQDLQPEFKPVKKIVLKPKMNEMPSSVNRFAVQSDINVRMTNVDPTSLGDLDDAPRVDTVFEDTSRSWDVDEGSLDVDGVLKEARHKERQMRLEEQRRKKMEKQRLSSKHSLEAVKLS